MTAERGGPAGRDGAHNATLDAPEMTGMGLPKRFAMAAECANRSTRDRKWVHLDRVPDIPVVVPGPRGIAGPLQAHTNALAKHAGRAASGSCNSDRHVG